MRDEAEPAAARPSYWLTRFAILRMLGLVYTVAFLVIVRQWQPLLGSDGLLPAASLLDAVADTGGSAFDRFWKLPTLFWLGSSDAAFRFAAEAGLVLSLLVLLGFANVPILL